MRRAGLIALACSMLAIAIPTAGAAEIYGLVIGIDDYDHIPDLDGAVNDAIDISEALEAIGADVTVLLDREATRRRILDTWSEMAERVGPGDLLVISYAGHGSNEPEFWEGNEADSKDETLLLSSFEAAGLGSSHRIRDDEIAQLIALSPPSQTVFVADACHAGTVSRSVLPVLGYRYYQHGGITDDALPPPPPNTSPDEGRGEIGLFLAAVDEAAKVPEFLIDGKPRGALSYAFANAIRGAADENADDSITLGEIETFVRRSIRQVSHGLQMPEIRRGGAVDDVLISAPGTEQASLEDEGSTEDVPAALPLTLWETPFAGLREPAIFWDSGSPFDIEGATLANDQSQADLVYDAETGGLISMVGDRIARLPSADRDALQTAVDKTRLADALMGNGTSSALDIQFSGGDRTYHEREIIGVQISGRASSYLTLVNLSADGRINYLYPVHDTAAGFMDPKALRNHGDFEIPLRITAPFGTEHILAIETGSEPADLRDAIAAYDGSRDIRGVWRQIQTIAGNDGELFSLAAFPFHSAE